MILSVENLTFYFGQRRLLDNVSLNLKTGGLLTVLGANGAGKSTLLNCMAGLLKPQKGRILLENEDISGLPAKNIAQKLAYVTQQPPHTYGYTVTDYVLLGRAAHLGLLSRPQAGDYRLAKESLERLGIERLAGKIYMQCSGGEKQLVNIARVLVQQPKLILFDEPTAALDYGNVLKTLRLVKELSEQGFTIIMTSHNPDHPILLHSKLPDSQTAILDKAGRLKTGNTADMITGENLNELYGINLCLVQVPALKRKVCAISGL